jgi:hypothetical protein
VCGKNKDAGVPVSVKNQPMVESVPAFHVILNTPAGCGREKIVIDYPPAQALYQSHQGSRT